MASFHVPDGFCRVIGGLDAGDSISASKPEPGDRRLKQWKRYEGELRKSIRYGMEE